MCKCLLILVAVTGNIFFIAGLLDPTQLEINLSNFLQEPPLIYSMANRFCSDECTLFIKTHWLWFLLAPVSTVTQILEKQDCGWKIARLPQRVQRMRNDFPSTTNFSQGSVSKGICYHTLICQPPAVAHSCFF